jgi:hypothetical protein
LAASTGGAGGDYFDALAEDEDEIEFHKKLYEMMWRERKAAENMVSGRSDSG